LSRRFTRFRVDADFLVQRVVLVVPSVQGWALDGHAFILYIEIFDHIAHSSYIRILTVDEHPIGIADENLVDITRLLGRNPPALNPKVLY